MDIYSPEHESRKREAEAIVDLWRKYCEADFTPVGLTNMHTGLLCAVLRDVNTISQSEIYRRMALQMAFMHFLVANQFDGLLDMNDFLERLQTDISKEFADAMAKKQPKE